jgi:sugar (pentulose or hexulose) kinase
MTAGPAADDVWVGLDLGTQSARAVALTGGGELVGAGSRPLTSRREGPRHEQDPGQWWGAIAGAAAEALRDVPAGAIRGVAVDATSGTVLLTDDTGTALTPGLMYDDTRAAAEVDRVNEVGEAVWAELGYRRMQASWALPKLVWLLQEHRTILGGVRLAHQNDVVNARLVGRAVAADLSNGLKSGAHLIDETWPFDVMESLGVPGSVLPPLVRSGAVIGTVCAHAAEATGLPVGTPVVSGMTDGCAAQLGAGVVDSGSWNSVLGTTLVVKGVTHDLVRDPLGVVYSHKAPDGSWLPGGASSTGAGMLTQRYPGRDLAELDHAAASRNPSRLVAYPLVSAGERFPFVAPDARAFELGEPEDDVDRYAAILQGVGYVERLCFDSLDLLGAELGGDLVLSGGATKSTYWTQLRADILDRPVRLPVHAEPAVGMAVLAASSGGSTSESARRMVRIRETVEPRNASQDRFGAAYLQLVEELERRGWLAARVAEHARARTPR